MKKAKLMLLSLILFAILGAMFAFKAKRFQTKFCSTTRALDVNLAQTNVCPFFTTSTTAPGSFNRYATSEKVPGIAVTTHDDCIGIVCPKMRLLID